ncbi:unnamed protein product [Boreogadus saida]
MNHGAVQDDHVTVKSAAHSFSGTIRVYEAGVKPILQLGSGPARDTIPSSGLELSAGTGVRSDTPTCQGHAGGQLG